MKNKLLMLLLITQTLVGEIPPEKPKYPTWVKVTAGVVTTTAIFAGAIGYGLYWNRYSCKIHLFDKIAYPGIWKFALLTAMNAGYLVGKAGIKIPRIGNAYGLLLGLNQGSIAAGDTISRISPRYRYIMNVHVERYISQANP